MMRQSSYTRPWGTALFWIRLVPSEILALGMRSTSSVSHRQAGTFAWLLVCPWLAFGIAWWYVRSLTNRFHAEPGYELGLLAVVIGAGILIWSLAYGLHRSCAVVRTRTGSR